MVTRSSLDSTVNHLFLTRGPKQRRLSTNTPPQQPLWEQMREGIPRELKQTFLIKGPSKLLQAVLFGVPIALFANYLISQQANKRDGRLALEKDLEMLDQTIKEFFHTIKSLRTLPRMSLFYDFDPDKIKADILKIELILNKVVILKEKNESSKDLKDKISRKENILKVSLSILEAILLNHEEEFDKAQQKIEEVQPTWKSLFDSTLADDEELKEILSNAYNVRGLVLRANIKMSKRNQCFELATRSFLMGLRVALPPQVSRLESTKENENIFVLIKEELNSLAVGFAKGEIPEKEVYGILLSNLGFLLNQWNKNEEALRCHKIAYDLFPHNCAVVNGLAHGLVQMGIFSKNPSLKQDCYKKACELYEHALKVWPKNHIIIANYAEMYLERAEEAVDTKQKEAYYKKAKDLLEPVVKQKEQEGKQSQKIWIGYAIALSNLGEKEKAREYLESSKTCVLSDKKSTSYINMTLLTKGPYQLPPFGGNGSLRKNYQYLATPPNFSNVKVEFSESDPLKTKIETDRTIIRPIQIEDQMFVWERLYGNKETMKLYHDRTPRNLKNVSQTIEKWNDLFKAGIPYSAYVVVSKNEPSERIGLIVMEAREEQDASPGLSQLFYLFDPEFSGDSYGTESLNAFMNHFVKDCLSNNSKFLVLGKKLEVTEMCALVENKASIGIIERHLKAEFVKQGERYGDKRNTYQVKWPSQPVQGNQENKPRS